MFNLYSLFLGVLAWCVPLLWRTSDRRRPVLVSFSACAVSLLFQLLEVRRRLFLQDWAGLLDTVYFSVVVAAILTAVTILVNLWPLVQSAMIQKTEENRGEEENGC